MPTKDELLSIVKMNAAAPMIDTDWFPNTPQYDLLYWSASPEAGYASYAWFVFFYDGSAYSGYRLNGGNYDLLVRLVR